MSQPSLYHWFESKEQLVEQIIVHLGSSYLAIVPTHLPPASFAELPRWIVHYTLEVWADPGYAAFVRFLFAIAPEHPRFRDLIHALYQRGANLATEALVTPYVERGEVDRARAFALVRTMVNAVGLWSLEERSLYGRKKPTPELLAFTEELVALMVDAIEAGATKPAAKRRKA